TCAHSDVAADSLAEIDRHAPLRVLPSVVAVLGRLVLRLAPALEGLDFGLRIHLVRPLACAEIGLLHRHPLLGRGERHRLRNAPPELARYAGDRGQLLIPTGL